MCGIAGIITSRPHSLSTTTLKDMGSALSRRGPDAEGLYCDEYAGLIHRRLSIIDLTSGAQPITCDQNRYTIVFNGEIYNFQTLKENLLKQGVVFHTQSDTEVLLQLWIKNGSQALNQLNGMFAFVIWDKQEKKLFAARDRMGKKPFYYTVVDNEFVFASELKAILKHPKIEKKLNLKAVSAFFTYESIPEPLTILENIFKLPAGHTLEWENSQTKITRYWNQKFTPLTDTDENTASKHIITLLDEATRLRMISDVPLGVFLSGGIDSSIVVALMAKHREGKDIETFSIHFEEASYDESLYSQTVAEKFGTHHHTEVLSAKRMLNILPEVTQYLDEPFADGSLLPTYLLSHFTRKHVTVALGGDGADELFCGYPTFFATQMALTFDQTPQFIKHIIKKISRFLPRSDKNMSLDFKLKQFLMAENYSGVLKNQIWLSGIPSHEQHALFTPYVLNKLQNFDPHELIESELQHCDSSALGDQLLYFYQKFYLQSDLLVKADRASMAQSLEVRAPFLDFNVVDYVNHLPYSFKLKGVTTKYLLKKTFNRILPAMITQRPKKGFGIPIAGWLKNELKDVLLHTLRRERIEKEGIFSWPTIEKYIFEHMTGKENHRKPLFCLLMFHLWMDEYLK